MARFYNALRYTLVAFTLGGIVVGLLKDCVLGVIQGEGCKWQPVWSFISSYYFYIGPLLLVLVVLFFLAWRAKRYDDVQKSFKLFKPVSKLRPQDLGFEELNREQRPNLQKRPYTPYIPRRLLVRDSQKSYTEEEVVDEILRASKGFILLGEP